MTAPASPEIVIANLPIRGLGAPIVYLCEYLGVPYMELNYPQGGPPDYSRDSFRSVKDTLGIPFANLPYIIDGEIRVAQSLACSRHICRRWGEELLGKNLQDLALVDTLSQILHDDRLNVQGGLGYSSKDPGPVLEEGHRRLDPIAEHLAGRQFLVGDYVTYIDFILWESLEFLNAVKTGVTFNQYPMVASYSKRVSSLPRFRQFLSSERFRKFPFSSATSPHGNG